MILNIYIYFVVLTQIDRKLNALKSDTVEYVDQNFLYNRYIGARYCVMLCPNSIRCKRENYAKYINLCFASDCKDTIPANQISKQKFNIDILDNNFHHSTTNRCRQKFLFLFHRSSSEKIESCWNTIMCDQKLGCTTSNPKPYHLGCPHILYYNNSHIRRNTKPKRFNYNKFSPEFVRGLQSVNMKKYIDFSINPCTDFYQFACGNWVKYNPISKDKTGYDIFEMLRENIDKLIWVLLDRHSNLKIVSHNYKKDFRKLLRRSPKYQKITNHTYKNCLKTISLKTHIVSDRIFKQMKRFKLYKINKKYFKTKKISAVTKAKLLFQSCMNIKVLNQRGTTPLLELLKDFGGWPVLDERWSGQNFDWLNLTAHLRLFNNDIFIMEWVGPDLKNSDVNIIQIDQANLGLPAREFFLNESNSLYLNAYKEFMISVMIILGAETEYSKKSADELLRFEFELANITTSPDDRMNFSIIYKRMSISNLCKQTPGIDWQYFLSTVQDRVVDKHETVVVYAINYFRRLSTLIKRTRSHVVANYVLWRFVRHRINNLDDRFKDSKQKFFQTLFGREQNPPRWKNCVAQVNSNMGMAVGSMFVRKYFDEKSKDDTLKMTITLQSAFLDILNETTWLDKKTKKLAELKLKSTSWKIGYPEFILSETILDEKYENLEINSNQYFENTLNVLKYITKTEQLKIGTEVDKTLWQIAPAVVNAYYSRNKNQIMFPAGILQPPFYHRFFPRSLNYGGIGVVIGHELTHGFDDKGRLFDANGNVYKWWSDYSIHEFRKRTKCLISQYGNYTVPEVGIIIDGEKTQGENIADNGGIKQAFRAYSKWLKNHTKIWCGAMRSEALHSKIKTAVHSPGKFRVIGSLSNLKEFADEFHCPIGSPMNPVIKCNVW